LRSASIIATFSWRVRRCGIGATVAIQDRAATQDRVGTIPRDWHRELKMTTLAVAAGRGGDVCNMSKMCATNARDYKLA
jgi:hypothetical protein